MKKLDYWMLNTIHEALQKEYAAKRHTMGYDSGFAYVAEEQGMKAAKEAEKELQENKFHPLGQIWQSMRRIEEMREQIS